MTTNTESTTQPVTKSKAGKPRSLELMIKRLSHDFSPYSNFGGRLQALLSDSGLTVDDWVKGLADHVGADFLLKKVEFYALDRQEYCGFGGDIYGYKTLKFSPRWALGKVWEQKNDRDGLCFPYLHECEKPSNWVHTGTDSCQNGSVAYYNRVTDIGDKGYFVVKASDELLYIVLI